MKCKVCGKRLKMDREKRYEVVKIPHSLNALLEEPIVFECFDCPKCGCQNAVNVRESARKEAKACTDDSTT